MALKFGTDGVRGIANTELTPEFTLALGRAAAQTLGGGRFVIGRDPRRSGDLLEAALTAGLLSQGADVLALGVVPTPGVSYVVRTTGASAGVVISASHNPMQDNGIKFFGPDGKKLADATEAQIQSNLGNDFARPAGGGVGKLTQDSGSVAAYADFLVATLGETTLAGLKLVIDGANGAASFLAKPLLERLGAEVVAIHCEPDGVNINESCGSTHAEGLAARTKIEGADAGLAFDGDADRVILADRHGRIFDGDRILLTGALWWKLDTVVGTVMSNMGLELALQTAQVRLERANVGDRYVAELLETTRARLGGEQSGHILFPQLSPAGDGLLTALQILKIVQDSGRDLATWYDNMTTLPQKLINVAVRERDGWEADSAIMSAILETEKSLEGRGRLLVRASGTEKLIRVMAEAPSEGEVLQVCEHVANVIREARGA
ncbi:MAG: phosphoglucosamine mutase [Armatimonadetes bacterium]|nr:phosphoglucosamine mutase [Armatimonadota bacterium]